MFWEFEIADNLSLRERICSPKDFAALRILILLLKELAPWILLKDCFVKNSEGLRYF